MGCGGSKEPTVVEEAPTRGRKGSVTREHVGEFQIKDGDIEDYFDVNGEIGRGGYSVVFEGKDKKSGQSVAIKKINKHEDGVDVDVLMREIKLMAKLDHPNVLKLHCVYQDTDHLYLVTELVEGTELFEKIIEISTFSERDASHILRQLVEGISYLHSNGIAHRDLKPENLLITDEKQALKIADFGFAKDFREDRMGTACGSPGYCAPEVLTDDAYSNAVDLWSIGVISFILLAGYPPFFGDSTPELFKKITDVDYNFDDPSWENISEDAKDLISKLLVKNADDRLTAAQALEHKWLSGDAPSTLVNTGADLHKLNQEMKKPGFSYSGRE